MSNIDSIDNRISEIDKLQIIIESTHNPKLTSAYCISSLVRGDFIYGKSDIDLLLIFKDQTPMEEMAQSAKKISNAYIELDKNEESVREMDVLYVKEKDVPKSECDATTTPFSIFGIFAFDIKENNKLLMGEDYLDYLYVIEPKKIVKKQINLWLNKAKSNPQNSLLYIGQIIRALSITFGPKSLKKQEVVNSIEKSDAPEWLKHYTKEHYSVCYECSSKKINSDEFIKKIEAYLKKIDL